MRATIGYDLLRTLAKTPPAQQTDIVDAKLPGFTLRWRPSGTHTYLFRTSRGWHKLGTLTEGFTPKAARKAAEAAQEQVRAGVDLHDARRAERAREQQRQVERATEVLTVRRFLEDIYAPWVETELKTKGETVARLGATFADLLDLALIDVATWHLETWRRARRKAKRKPETLNRDMNDLRAMFTRAVEWKHLTANPLASVKREKVDKRKGWKVRYLSADEEQRLRGALQARDLDAQRERVTANAWRTERAYATKPDIGPYADHLAPLVVLAINTGLRRGELFGLRWSDIDWAVPQLTVRGSVAKDADTRHVPLNREALTVLTTWRGTPHPPATALVFPGADGTPLVDVKKGWAALLTDAQIERFRFHDLRHTFASKLVQRGIALQVVADLLGHSTVVMTERYAHLAPNQTRDAVAALLQAPDTRQVAQHG